MFKFSSDNPYIIRHQIDQVKTIIRQGFIHRHNNIKLPSISNFALSSSLKVKVGTKEQIHRSIIKTLKLKGLKIQVDHISKSGLFLSTRWYVEISKSLSVEMLQLIRLRTQFGVISLSREKISIYCTYNYSAHTYSRKRLDHSDMLKLSKIETWLHRIT